MSGLRTLGVVVALALTAVVAIIGMLLVDNVYGDALLLVLAALPLLIGFWRWRAEHRK